MATSTAKAPNGAARTTAPSSANGSPTERLSQQDTRLLKLVRTNIQPIVAGVLAMASRSGEERDYARMNECQTLASQLATLGGLASATAGAASAPAAMTAAAGAGAH
jgi:hypothetical protein